MTYRLKAHKSVSKGIKRIASEQIEKAISELSATDELGVDEAVHQVRKRLKKTRAVVRLIRDSLGKKSYKRENARFRDLGRNLASLRDGKVQIEALNKLTTHFADIAPETFTDMRQELQVDYRREYQQVLNEGILISIKNQLKDAKEAIADWTIEANDWSAIDKSLKRIYHQGCKGLDQSRSKPTAENFHEWRKRVKYLRYQLEILNQIWSEVMKQWVDQTHNLSDYLGEDHDLAVLEELVLSQQERFDREDTLETLTALIDRRRQELQSAAIFLGKRIYTEKPKDFTARLGNYWQVWQTEI
ncbi:CHAD domain-containing protein [Pleurocapsa sp. FMAR1]|uniref:CHAD domain-containing protein n=1 Tax=Pleurocapsa sp. FMAR1 TaxID=3040204 RepID=UPI0029C8DC74|nr:CHAD domain-containing protein [Pleurocapsa sp. FMAR1]